MVAGTLPFADKKDAKKDAKKADAKKEGKKDKDAKDSKDGPALSTAHPSLAFATQLWLMFVVVL
jgi:hypothetical protein